MLQFDYFDKEKFLEVALSHMGRFYLWGGDDPSGFDCSGFVLECLYSIGAIPTDVDMTADGLWKELNGRHGVSRPTRGSVIFWFKGEKAIHVAICVSDRYYIGAEGGGSKVVDMKSAIKHNAFIKQRRINNRNQRCASVNIFND